jgi:integrase
VNKHPRLRTRTYKAKSGQVHAYYFYDRRSEGLPEVALGKDYDRAIQEWRRLHEHLPQTRGTIQEAIDAWKLEVLPTYTGETLKGYAKNLRQLEPVFGKASWIEVTFPALKQYLRKRTAKTQGNREMSLLQIIWHFALGEGMTTSPWPAAGIRGWKNQENAREFEVTDELFNAVYEQADQVLKDAMDIATATGMRLGDVRRVPMPTDGKLKFRSHKTGKQAFFDVAESQVLTDLVARRGQKDCTMLLCTSTGRAVSASMLRARYEEARKAAATANPKLADGIKAMYLRDTRKRAADLADDMDAASALLQHSSTKITATHYRTKATKLKSVR